MTVNMNVQLTNLQQEAVNVVKRLNRELELKYKKKCGTDDYRYLNEVMPVFSVSFQNDLVAITLSIPYTEDEVPLNEILLYSNYNELRKYNEVTDKYESLYMYVKQRFRDYKNKLNDIKI